MTAYILDTETDGVENRPVQVAYLSHGRADPIAHDQLYHPGNPISPAAMAVHHILDADVASAPPYTTFRLPDDAKYLIGHNIDFDLAAIARCGQPIDHIKTICTLAISRSLWPDLPSHALGAVLYGLASNPARARTMIQGAHNAMADVLLVQALLRFVRHKTGHHSAEALHELSEQARVPDRMRFGKHKGVLIADLPEDYVQWLRQQDNIDPHLLRAFDQHRP